MKRYFKLAWSTVPVIGLAALGWNSLLLMQSFCIVLLIHFVGAALIIFYKETP